MRIRKNTKFSSLLFPHSSGGERPQTHVCHLNQSPWDVISFSSSAAHQQDSSWYLPSSSSSSPHLQFGGEDSFTGNVSLGDSIGAVESVASMEKLDFMALEDNEKSEDEAADRLLAKSRGNKSKADEHVWSLKSGGGKRVDKAVSPAAASAAGIKPPRRGRPRGGGKKVAASASNPYEFYYYSGFGPRWGKRRGGVSGGGDEGSKSRTEDESIISADGDNRKPDNPLDDKTASFDNFTNGGLDYMDDEEDDEDSFGKMKKRARKPVKARSLKSLM